MTTFMFIGMIAGAVVGPAGGPSHHDLPVFTGFHNDSLGDLFPILFVTVACGAVSRLPQPGVFRHFLQDCLQ